MSLTRKGKQQTETNEMPELEDELVCDTEVGELHDHENLQKIKENANVVVFVH